MEIAEIKVNKYYKFLGYKVKCLSLENGRMHVARVPWGIFQWYADARLMTPWK